MHSQPQTWPHSGNPHPSALIDEADADRWSPLDVVNAMLRHRYRILAAALVTLAVVSVFTLLQPRTYSSTASLTGQAGRSQQGALSALAAQLGAVVPLSEGNQSPYFYADLLESREILTSVARSVYRVQTPAGTRQGTLLEILPLREGTEAQRLEDAITRLKSSITTSVLPRTGVVNLRVTTRHPELSHGIAANLLNEVGRFNLESRQSQAGAERRFIGERLAEASVELQLAEQQLERFLETNRARASARLSFEESRLRREVAARQQVQSSLAQSLEQAKIDEVRDTPVITVIERPVLAARPNSRGMGRRAFLALFVGALLGLLMSASRDWVRRRGRAYADPFSEFAALRAEAVDDIRHPSRIFRRRRSGSSRAA